MQYLYSLLTNLAWWILHLVALFSPKMKLFVNGRKNTFTILKNVIKPIDQNIWFHCASLGEFEQGLPIMEALKSKHPSAKIIITFFSPSGYEQKKNTPIADVVCYLPMDTLSRAKKFIELVNPTLAVFVKYEVWPNYMTTLKNKQIKTILISGLFRKEQVYFKPFGNFMRGALAKFDHYFVQNQESKELLESIKLSNISVSGDTRFDRVSHQIEMDNAVKFMDEFTNIPNCTCIICGSTWPEDEEVLIDYINSASSNVKFVIAPHKIDLQKIKTLRQKLTSTTSVTYSEYKKGTISNKKLEETNLLIVDTIGYLTKIYSYADIAYVGGAMGETGLHNILEPATFGVPIIIGKNFVKFPEAERLRSLAGLFSVSNKEECNTILNKLVSDANFRKKTGMICGHFVNSNTGATNIIIEYLDQQKIL